MSILLTKKHHLIFTSLILFTLASCSQGKHEGETHDANSGNVHGGHQSRIIVSNPDIRNVSLSKAYVAQVRSSQHIEVKSYAEGYLENIYVNEGNFVEEGDLLFQIRPFIYQAELNKAKAEADVMLVEYKNTQLLTERKIVSDRELAIAGANLRKAEAEVLLAETHLGFTNISAPFSGIIDRIELRKGSLIEEGERLTNLSDNRTMWVYFNVPEAEYLQYIRAENDENQTTVELQMADNSIFENLGKITTIEADFNNHTGTIQFRADFPNPGLILRDGQTGNVIINRVLNNVVVIPQKAVFEILDQSYVFIVDKDGVVHQRHINIAHELEDIFIIDEGISQIDQIVIEGLRQVQDGSHTNYDLVTASSALSHLKLPAE